MTVLVYVDWADSTENLTPTPDELTCNSPNIPDGMLWKGVWADVAASAGSPWNGQTLLDCSSNWTYGVYDNTDIDSSTVNVNAGRVLVQWETSYITETSPVLTIHAASDQEWRLRLFRDLATLDLSLYSQNWNLGNEAIDFLTGLQVGDAYNFEIIYDLDESVANDRLRYRYWAIGGTPPGSFTSSSSQGSGAGTRTQPSQIQLGSYNNGTTRAKFGKLIISDDVDEDLSSWSPSAGGVLLPNRAHRNTLLRM